MISIAIINLKGGVGKSVTACNLAAEFAGKGKTVLVVDLDKQGNTSKFFEVCDYDRPSVAQVLTGESTAQNTVRIAKSPAGVGVLPCDMRMLKTNRSIMLDNGPRQYYLRDALEPVSWAYDICLLDCPPDLDMGSINALCMADWALIPVDCDEWACDGMAEIIDQIHQVQMYYNPRLKIMGTLLTKYRRTIYAATVAQQLHDLQDVPLLQTVIRYTVRVSEAKSEHKPLMDYDPFCTAAQDYSALAYEILGIVSKSDTQEG